MKHVRFLCISLCLTATFSLFQSNPVPMISQNASVAAPISAVRGRAPWGILSLKTGHKSFNRRMA